MRSRASHVVAMQALLDGLIARVMVKLALALRCGQITNNGKSIRIYAGCGIVAGSDPEREHAES